MKRLTVILSIIILFISCKSELTKKEKMEVLLSDYKLIEDEELIDASFQNEIYELREDAIKDNDILIFKSIDSLIKLGLPAPSFKQEVIELDSINTANAQGRKCRTIDDAPSDVLRIKANSLRLPSTPITIPVFFHVIQSEDGEGFISKETLENQLKVLNDNFSSTLFSFTYGGEDYKENSDWYSNVDIDNTQEAEMHKTLAVNPKRNLNVYFIGNSDYIGYARFPWDFKDAFDGVVIYNLSVPGGTLDNYNEGKTLTHEVGHYLGLWHTFHKGCNVGDSVSDTPAQAVSTDGCPKDKDTCPNDPGDDPIDNYMDYSYDSCMTKFTDGQNGRMNWAVREYRTDFMVSEL